jgi:hypothetical protein
VDDLVTIDFETHYSQTYSLSKITVEEYIRSPLFEVIGVAIKINDGQTKWYPKPEAAAGLASINWGESLVVAQNCAFDGAILAWHYGVKPLAWGDTLSMARALFPHEKSHSLSAQATRAGVGVKGTEVLNAIGKRYEHFTPEDLHKYGLYCINDVELTYELFRRYMAMGFPKKELKLIDMTIRMFTEPHLILDKDLLEDHLLDVRAKKHALIAAIAGEGNDEEVKKVLMSNERFAQALIELGVEPPKKISPTTGKEAYAFAKTDEAFTALQEHEDERVQALVAARLGTKTTIEETRTEAMISVSNRGALPVPLRYYGAMTGRWSADGGAKGSLNMQNVPRDSPIKAAIKPPDGYVLCGADLSNIELRLGLWLSGQDDKLQLLADGLDLYKDFASTVFNVAYDDVTKQQRQVGKTASLSLIYSTGAKKLQDALRIMGKIKMTVEETKRIVDAYRSNYRAVVQAWQQGEAALQAINADESMALFRNGICTVEGKKGIRLPSGMYLQYPNLRRVVEESTGKAGWVFDSKYGPERLYGGKVFQQCDQSIARCIMAEGLLRIQKWADIKLMIHDSAYWLAKEEDAEASLKRGVECLTAPISYCPGLPLAAEGGFGKSLKEC